MDKRKDVKVDCPNNCGGKFGPAGLSYHLKFCTGPGYKAGHTHSVPGSHDTRAKRANLVVTDGRKAQLPCRKGCGRSYSAAGRSQHEKHCTGQDYVPGYSYQRRAERNITNPAPQDIGIDEEIEQLHTLFHGNAALFSATCYLLAANSGVDVESNLLRAKTMIDLKLRSLGR